VPLEDIAVEGEIENALYADTSKPIDVTVPAALELI